MARKSAAHKPKEVAIQSAFYTPRCPACGSPVILQATVETFGEPQGWHFYGREGERWMKCRGESGGREFVHFVTAVNGRYSHRLAWLKPAGEGEAVQRELL